MGAVTCTIDTSGMSSLIRELIRRSGAPANEVLKDTGRLLAVDCIKITPPKGPKQCEATIRKDLKNAFAVASAGFIDEVGAKHGLSNIDAFYGQPGGKPLHLRWDRLDPSGGGMKAFHRSQRNSRGRVANRSVSFRSAGDSTEWLARYAVSRDDYDRYEVETFSHVGRAKAGWLPGWKACGGGQGSGERIPQYVMRHFEQNASKVKGSFDLSHLSATGIGEKYLEITNYAPGVKRAFAGGILRAAVRARTNALKTRIKHGIETGDWSSRWTK